MKRAPLLTLCALGVGLTGLAQAAAPEVHGDEIGGVVRGPKGPEAGVWVIAETDGLPTSYSKIVVTDDQGRYLLPALPAARYRLWTRGYGLVDAKPVEATPGQQVDLAAQVAPDRRAAAEYYPSNYWFALLRPPTAAEFPGTGQNGIAPAMVSQQHWIGFLKENCFQCHQIGDAYTRALPGSGVEGWRSRLLNGSGEVSDPRIDRLVRSYRTDRMYGGVGKLGLSRALEVLADWTDRIADGALPFETPPRPTGVERNIVLTIHGWAHTPDGTSQQVHDEIATDKRDPTVNAHGPVYGAIRQYGQYGVFDPRDLREYNIDIPGVAPPRPHNIDAGIHNPMIDRQGRVWGSLVNKEGPDFSYCSDGGANKFAKYYPNASPKGRYVSVYDPRTKDVSLVPVCFGTHHLNFTDDGTETLYFSGDFNVMGWLNTSQWDKTHNAEAAIGWCPMVLDTNGDGKIDVDRGNWNFIVNPDAGAEEGAFGDGSAPVQSKLDPSKDTRISSFLYGMAVNHRDDSVWYGKVQPSTPSGIVRLSRGASPPESCKTEYYEPPRRADGSYRAYDGRGVDVDSQGIVWMAFASGQLGRFDRSRCKVVSGPSAVGQQCPEGWSFIDLPGPKITGTSANADFTYLIWVDLHNVLGLGKDVPIVTGSNSDSLMAYLPRERRWVTMRVPYPMGFYSRGLDGRIDDPAGGWRGRAIWATYGVSQHANLHIEGGDQKLVEFQLRPNPLAR